MARRRLLIMTHAPRLATMCPPGELERSTDIEEISPIFARFGVTRNSN